MASVIAWGQQAKALVLYSYQGGILQDAVAVSFAIFSITGDNIANPVQISPSSGTTAIDLVANRLGVGRFWCPYTPATNSDPEQRVVWTYQLVAGGPFNTAQEDFYT